MRRTRALAALLALPLGLALSAAARAELVILTDGGCMKVKEYTTDGERAMLTLPSGGRMALAIERIDRVVDDEWVPPPPPPVAAAAPAPALPLAFDASQKIPDGPYGKMIYEAAKRHALNPQIVSAVIRAESAGNARAFSPKGARGLMQLMPSTAYRFGVARGELWNPERNLEAGVSYLKWLSERFGNDLGRILAAYNAGEGSVDKYQGIPPYRETRDYVRRIYTTLGLTLANLGAGMPAAGR
jgi:soluble lytic murein transglycosylase-like protein